MTAPAWSPARSTLRRRCLRQYLLRYVLNATPAQPDDAPRVRGRVIHTGLAAAFTARSRGESGDLRQPAMARYYPMAEAAMRDSSDYPLLSTLDVMSACGEVYQVLASIPPPHPAAILGVESPFHVMIYGEQITGIIDYVLRTSAISVHIRDWKSGAVDHAPSTDPAVPVYGAAAIRKWPWAKVITIGLYSTRTRSERIETLNLDQIDDALTRLANDAYHERVAVAELSAATVDALYPLTPGGHCRTCVFRSYCPQFRTVTDLPIRAGVDVVAERERLVEALEQCSRPELPSVTESPTLGGEA